MPANFARPLIATEDKRFYAEPGVDVLAVGRVAWAKVSNGSDQGGATLEQQLAKMLYTPTETGPTAELKQVVLAFKLNAPTPRRRSSSCTPRSPTTATATTGSSRRAAATSATRPRT